MIDKTTMTEERLKSLLAAYGGDPARWPLGEREAALSLLQTSAAARSAADEARALDAVLGGASAVEVPAELTARRASSALVWQALPVWPEPRGTPRLESRFPHWHGGCTCGCPATLSRWSRYRCTSV